eukprot:g9309.t1
MLQSAVAPFKSIRLVKTWKEDLDYKLDANSQDLLVYCKTCTELGPSTRLDLVKECSCANSRFKTNKSHKIIKHL